MYYNSNDLFFLLRARWHYFIWYSILGFLANLNLQFMVVLFCREGGNIDAGTETNVNLYHEVYYHFLGTDQSEDILCWRDPDNPKHSFGTGVTDDGRVSLCFNYLVHIFAISTR